MGGSGSPSTTRAGAAGCGVTGLGVDGLGAAETGVILPDLWLSAIGKSDVAAPAAVAGPEPGGWRPRPPFAEKAEG